MGSQAKCNAGVCRVLLIVSLISLVLFSITGLLVGYGFLSSLDSRADKWVPHSDSVFWSITTSSADVLIVSYIVALPVYYKYRGSRVPRVYYGFLASILIGMILVAGCKICIAQPRPGVSPGYLPLLSRLRHIDLYAFPSGHTVRATIIGWYIAAGRKARVKLLVSIWVLIVGFSRIVVGAHWMSDVIGGFLLGIGVASLVDYYFTLRCPS